MPLVRYNLYGYVALAIGQQLLQLACLPKQTNSELARSNDSAPESTRLPHHCSKHQPSIRTALRPTSASHAQSAVPDVSAGAKRARWADLGAALCRWRMVVFSLEFVALSFGVGVVPRTPRFVGGCS